MSKQLSRRAFLRTTLASGASLAAAAVHAAPAGIYKPGTYSAKAAGIGDVVVTMTFDAEKITDVVLDVSHETPSIGQAAAESLKKSLMAAQSAEIDACFRRFHYVACRSSGCCEVHCTSQRRNSG